MTTPPYPPAGHPGAGYGAGHPGAGYGAGHPGAGYGAGAPGAAQPAVNASVATKKRNRGCLIAAMSGCSVLLLAMVVGGYFLYEALKDSPLREIADAVGEGVEVWQEARTAPGTNGMREAGCNEAMAVGRSDLGRIVKHLDADAGAEIDNLNENSPGAGAIVICTMGMWAGTDKQRTCDKIAKAYIADGGQPEGNFMLSVTKSGAGQAVCAGLYDTDGKQLEPVDPNNNSYPTPP